MPIPKFEAQQVQRVLDAYGESRVPARFRNEIQVIARKEGNSFFLIERRPGWRRRGEWTESPIAKFRYFVGRREWVLYWANRNERWFQYDLVEASPDIGPLLAEVDRDPTGIFWG